MRPIKTQINPGIETTLTLASEKAKQETQKMLAQLFRTTEQNNTVLHFPPPEEE
jgi:hypothetical protein